MLAVDLGTGGPKVALVAADGTVIAHTYRTTDLILIDSDGVEQDPDDIWQAISDGARTLMSGGHVDRDRVVAVSISSLWMSAVPVDADGNHIGNLVSWMDSRGAASVRERVRSFVSVAGYDARKLKTWLQTTGGIPSLSGKDMVGHALWLKDHDPERYRAAHKILDVPDYLNMRLTGRAVTTPDVAIAWWAIDTRELDHVHWVDELVGWIDVDRSKLPELIPTGSIVGTVLPEVAEQWGLGPNVAVTTATGDTAAAGIGAGAVRDHQGYIYVGTSSWLSCHVPYKRTDLRSNITSLPAGIPGRYWVATEQDVAGKALNWLIDNVLYPDDGLGGPAPDDVYERLAKVAADVPSGANGVIFTPWLVGERTPVDNHTIRGGFHRLQLETTRADLVRAVYEGVALNTRWMLQAAERFTKQRFDQLTYVGGGARTDLWCQIMADVLDRPIRRPADPVLANVRGAGMAAHVALGNLTWDGVADLTDGTADRFEPDPSSRAVHDRHFEAFVEIYKKNKGIHSSLARADRH